MPRGALRLSAHAASALQVAQGVISEPEPWLLERFFMSKVNNEFSGPARLKYLPVSLPDSNYSSCLADSLTSQPRASRSMFVLRPVYDSFKEQ